MANPHRTHVLLTAAACGLALAATAHAELIRRYSFESTYTLNGTNFVQDVVGGKDGWLLGSATVTGGALVNPNARNGGEVHGTRLPADTFSGLSSATIEFWAGMHSFDNNNGRRCFHFAGNNSIEGGIFNHANTGGVDWWKLTLLDYRRNGGGGWDSLNARHDGLGNLTGAGYHYMAIVIDDAADTLKVYFGKRAGSGTYTMYTATRTGWTESLATILPTVNSIGTASYGQYFNGAITEFRIYGHPLSADEVAANVAAGPDHPPAPPTRGTVISIR